MNDKQAEQQLCFLTVIAERVSEGIVVVDLNGVIRFVNPAWVVMHGYNSADELLGEHISKFHTEEQMRIDVIEFIEEAKRRGQLAGPVEHVRSDGTVFPTQTKMITVKLEEGRDIGLVVFASDVSSHSQAQRHLSRQADESITALAINEQLRSRIFEHEQSEKHFKQQIAELTSADKRLQDKIAEHQRELKVSQEDRDQLEKQLREQIAKLKDAVEKLQHETTKRQQVEERLAAVQSRLDNINVILHRHL